MPEGFGSVSLKTETLQLLDRIRDADPHSPSRASIIAAAVESHAKKLGVPA